MHNNNFPCNVTEAMVAAIAYPIDYPIYGDFRSKGFQKMFENNKKSLINLEEILSSGISEVEEVEEDDKFIVYCVCPGAKKEFLNIEVRNNVLSVSHWPEDKDKDRFTKGFEKMWNLPDEDKCDVENISATYKNGVLTIEIPKTPPAEPKVLDIKVK